MLLPLRRAPKGAYRTLSALPRPFSRPAPATTTSRPRFSSTTTTTTTTTTTRSTPSPPTAANTPPTEEQPPPPPPPRARRSLRPFILSTLFLAAGLVAGNIVRFTIAPPPLPDPGTDMDDALQGKLRDELDALPVVREHEALLSSSGGEWVEVEAWGALGGARRPRPQLGGRTVAWGKERRGGLSAALPLLDDERHVVSQTLAAMKGFGPARRFANRRTRESVTVFWVGGGLTGWPGVAHGGALATAFLEAFGWVGGKAPEDKRTAEPAKLTLTYLAPTMASNFFVLKAAPASSPAPRTDLPPQKDMTKRPVPSDERPSDGGEEWSGTLQAVQGRVCVKANAVLAQ
ncbi:hypothetical protein B0J12DRAFT_734411 [Macrophomina phaseolina]|uniref:Thioesterase domain-containing protein n=1 Tax=Macrophomina phaseolina TaxID=35725 RepID=A0ABQ8GUT6_9PEZI|nr:hypothetical protein B0J12DRAFT_734411 [Macrophomina phaseolina]